MLYKSFNNEGSRLLNYKTHVIYMVNIFGYELDIVSFIPALLGVLLSLYNWYLARKPANIHPSDFMNMV